jgi:hypothetical protein
LLVLLGTIGTPDLALADTVVISRPGAHPSYSFEAEPHLLIGALPAPKPARGTGFGFGFRGTVELVDNGFISSINNSVGFGFGADWVHYDWRRLVEVNRPRLVDPANPDLLYPGQVLVLPPMA